MHTPDFPLWLRLCRPVGQLPILNNAVSLWNADMRSQKQLPRSHDDGWIQNYVLLQYAVWLWWKCRDTADRSISRPTWSYYQLCDDRNPKIPKDILVMSCCIGGCQLNNLYIRLTIETARCSFPYFNTPKFPSLAKPVTQTISTTETSKLSSDTADAVGINIPY